MKRDAKGRPIKPPMIGKTWSVDDVKSLADALVEIAQTRPGDALELLDHGYVRTPLAPAEYDYVKDLILQSKKGSRK